MNPSSFIGEKFGNLKVVSLVGKDKWNKYKFLCRCDCGNESVAVIGNLQRGNTKSCGCMNARNFMQGNQYSKGRIPWNKNLKGIHLSPKSEFKKGRKDEKHPEWKGENVSYSGLHHWVARWKGKPSKCEQCGTMEAEEYDWANVSGEYKRDLDDYIRLCRVCHHRMDNISEKLWKKRHLQSVV